MKKWKLLFNIGIIFLISGCMSFHYQRNLPKTMYPQVFTKTLFYMGLYIDKHGYYKQNPIMFQGNPLTALSKAFQDVLRSTNLFKRIIITESEEESQKALGDTCLLIIKTDHLTFQPGKSGFEVKIRVYVMIYSDNPLYNPPFYYRVYRSEAYGGVFSNPIGIYYSAVDKILNRFIHDLSGGDFNNPDYKSVLKEDIQL